LYAEFYRNATDTDKNLGHPNGWLSLGFFEGRMPGHSQPCSSFGEGKNCKNQNEMVALHHGISIFQVAEPFAGQFKKNTLTVAIR
jgi:hypothetical protein